VIASPGRYLVGQRRLPSVAWWWAAVGQWPGTSFVTLATGLMQRRGLPRWRLPVAGSGRRP
jgi:hypothetical protein